MNYYYDLHMHSCLSPCADDNLTPENLVGMAHLAGLDIIALTDHNTCENCAAALSAGERRGLCVLPGMELTTSEEVHVLFIFKALEAALEFSDYVKTKLPKKYNNPHVFGSQLLYDVEDAFLGYEPRLLATATEIGIYDTARLAEFYNGVAIPSHINRQAFSLLSNLGIYDGNLGFKTVEIRRETQIKQLLDKHPALRGLRVIRNSDAHSLKTIPDAKYFLSLNSLSPAEIIARLAE